MEGDEEGGVEGWKASGIRRGMDREGLRKGGNGMEKQLCLF